MIADAEVCPECGRVLREAQRYRLRHLQAEHCPCPECGRLFTVAGMARHRRVHGVVSAVTAEALAVENRHLQRRCGELALQVGELRRYVRRLEEGQSLAQIERAQAAAKSY